MALEVFQQRDDVVFRRCGDFGVCCGSLWCGLQEKRLADVGVEQMFCGGEARGVFGRVGEAGDVNDDGVGGFFGAEAFAGFDATFSESARETEDSGDGLDVFLLLVAEGCKCAAIGAWLEAAMESDGPAEEIPLFVGPARRHRKLAQEASRGFAAGFARGLGVADSADAMEACGGAHDAAHVLLAESRRGVGAA